MDNKFGLFIHWGIYSIPAVHEQVLTNGDWPHDKYEALMCEFDPYRYDPDEWVSMAKNAGMRYICFTAKHHDGFCMWDTKETDYKITNTPYGKDTLKMLADACSRHDVALSIYYSIPDWHHPHAYNPLSSHQWKAKEKENNDFSIYKDYIKAQVKELLTGYGKIYTFFWDIPPHIYDPSVNELVRSLQPDILINDRGFDGGDFSTPERTVPEGERFPSRTEACQSVGEYSWGYRKDEDYFSAGHLMSSIDKIMAMGGSYLLNVGPTSEGVIPPESKAIIERIGRWYKTAAEGLENTEPSSYSVTGSDKYIAVNKGNSTYFHFWNGMNSTAMTFRDTSLNPRKAILCNNGKELPIRFSTLPTFVDKEHIARTKYHSVTNIPVDDLAGEPIVIRIDW